MVAYAVACFIHYPRSCFLLSQDFFNLVFNHSLTWASQLNKIVQNKFFLGWRDGDLDGDLAPGQADAIAQGDGVW